MFVKENNPLGVDRSVYLYTGYAALFLIILQFLDAFFTGIGVYRFGIESEGNPLLRELMIQIGTIPALALVKLFAIGCIITMALLVNKVRWVPHALVATCGIYLAFAVLPWGYYLFLSPWLETVAVVAN